MDAPDMVEVQAAAKFIIEQPELCTSSLLSTAQTILISENHDDRIQPQSNISDKLDAILNGENVNKERVRYFRHLICKYLIIQYGMRSYLDVI